MIKKALDKIIEIDLSDSRHDHFVRNKDEIYAGDHLIIDLWGARNLKSSKFIEATLNKCVVACKATVLHSFFHEFGKEGGISGVLVLAESHISIHTWPENSYGAIDIFMCGKAQPYRAIKIIEDNFIPKKIKVSNITRGKIKVTKLQNHKYVGIV